MRSNCQTQKCKKATVHQSGFCAECRIKPCKVCGKPWTYKREKRDTCTKCRSKELTFKRGFYL